MKNFKLLSTVIAVLFSALLFQSCKDDDNDEMRMDNQTFVVQASSSNSFEIAAGNLAITKGESGEVKDYGHHMVTDHTAVGIEMAALAKTKGWEIPDALQPKEQANLNKLNALSGAEFDQQFANIMVASHVDAIDLFEMASGQPGVADADLRKFAAEKLPALKMHLEEAENLKAQMN